MITETEYVLAQSPEDDSVYLFRADGEELVVPEEEEFDRVATYYNDELVEKQKESGKSTLFLRLDQLLNKNQLSNRKVNGKL